MIQKYGWHRLPKLGSDSYIFFCTDPPLFFFSLRHPWFQSLVQVYAFVRLMEVTASERSPNSPPRLPWHRDTGPQSWLGKSAVGIDLPHPAGPEFQSPGHGGKFNPPIGRRASPSLGATNGRRFQVHSCN